MYPVGIEEEDTVNMSAAANAFTEVARKVGLAG